MHRPTQLILRGALALLASASWLHAAHDAPLMDARATFVPMDEKHFEFGADPVNLLPYDYQRQLDIYGAKHNVPTARPLLEIGRDLYGPGTFKPGIPIFGEKNLVFPQFLVYGDFRLAAAYNWNGGISQGVTAALLNIDFDLRITATERFHLFYQFLNRDGHVTGSTFNTHDGNEAAKIKAAGANAKNLHLAQDQSHFILNDIPTALFFEGDFARILSGFTDHDYKFDLPFTFGLIPLIFQNGVWMQDAFDGFAITIPARNSPHLQITNMDVTFFAGFDQVTTAAIPNDHQANVFGLNAFVEANKGYYEFGFGYIDGKSDSHDLSYFNATAAFTRRYFDLVSNSFRVIVNFGQEPGQDRVRNAAGGSTFVNRQRTADGVLLLMENSLISPKPLTLVPYLNLFAGFGVPQSIARAGTAGGVLLNTGLNFETDNMTGFPKLDDTGHNTWGGALGVEYLFHFDQQIVVELAGLNVFGDREDRTAAGYQVGVGIRYQLPLNNAWILRADGIAAIRDREENLLGVRLEIRRKF